MVKKILLIIMAMLIVPTDSGAEKFIPPAYIEEELIVDEAELEHEEPMNESQIERPMDNDCEDLVYVGNFKITYYCTCAYCCGSCTGLTASGNPAIADHTVATDTAILPFGTHIYIEGLGERVCEDTGGAIKGYILDVLVESHEKALQMGVDYLDVYIVKEN